MSDLQEAAALRRVWCAVIHTALDDACRKPTRTNARRRADAIAWLTEPNDDFNLVCQLAGLEQDRVRTKAKELIEEAERAQPSVPPMLATPKRSSPKLYQHDGLSLPLSQWADRSGISFRTLCSRLKNGWSIERSLTEGVHSARRGTNRASITLATPLRDEAPGVAEDFPVSAGTGVGSATRDSAEMEFSQSTEPAE